MAGKRDRATFPRSAYDFLWVLGVLTGVGSRVESGGSRVARERLLGDAVAVCEGADWSRSSASKACPRTTLRGDLVLGGDRAPRLL